MMTSPLSAFCLTLLFMGRMAQINERFSSSHHQEETFVLANVGESLTLQCFDKDSSAFYWYKQSLGQKSRLISSLYSFDEKGTFYDEFKNNPRFTLDTGTGKSHLKITNLSPSDSGFYCCIKRKSINIEVVRLVFVSVGGSRLNFPAFVYQSASETDQPEGSVSCTVHTGSCGGEHSVYWFRDSRESHPGLIYTQGGRNDQCERENDTQTHTCVYNLPMKSLNLSHAETYYCAVASCGHILFREGIKLDFENERNALVYFLGGALIFTSILVVFLSVSMYRNGHQSRESKSGFARSSVENTESHQDEAELHYAAFRVNLPSRSRRQRKNTETECVYSSVKN